uniref:C2 domain-containing protein n=1 Tax=Rhabditophanes sp. KR3021 TaxID=114890 RepID=A0AC35U7W2_9BILA
MQTPLKKSSCIAPPPNIADLLKPRRNSANHQPNLLPSVSPSSPRDTPVIISQNDTPISTVSNSPNPLSQQPTISKSDSSTYGNNGSVYNDSRRSSIAQDRDAFRFRNGSMAHLFEQQHLIHMRDKSPSRNSNLTLESQHSTEQLNSFASSKSGSIIEKDDDGTVSTIGSISSSGSATAPLTAACNKKPENLGLDPSHYTGLLSKENKPETVILSASGQQIMPGTEECRKKGLGLVTCTLQHFPVRKRFRVTVIKVEGLAGELKPDMELLPFCRVSLAPAKNSKAQDSAVKRGRDVAFNQEFFFDNVAVEDLENKTITVVFLHQPAAKLQKETEIGEFSIELKDFPLLTTKKEVKIVDELKVKFNSKKIGKIYFSTQVVKEAKTLTINLNKVEDLPKWGLCGAPDVCVRVSVTQADGKVQTKQSRVLKNTCKAVYQESIMFLISTKVGDLRKTQITISAIDMQRHGTGDDVIGSSYLGSIAMDKSEVEQWKNTIEHLGKEYKASHHLKLDLPVTREYIDEKETNNNVKKDEFSDELFDSEDLLK